MLNWIMTLLTIVVICVLLGSQYGCSTTAPTLSDGRPGIQLLPDVEDCHGRMSGSFSLSGTGIGAAAATGTFSADCGDGFRLIHPDR